MYRYKVDKMGCGGCAKLVTVSGAVGPSDRIAQAIAAAGYPTELLRATA